MLLFIAGFTVVFMAVNILGGTVGRFFIEYADVITRIMGVVIILLGLVFIGALRVRAAHRSTRRCAATSGSSAPLSSASHSASAGRPASDRHWRRSWPCRGTSATRVRAGLLGLAYSLGLGIPFILITLGFGWATRSVSFLRRHIRAVNIVGGSLLVALGILMVTGVWSALMAQLQGVFLSVPLPL